MSLDAFRVGVLGTSDLLQVPVLDRNITAVVMLLSCCWWGCTSAAIVVGVGENVVAAVVVVIPTEAVLTVLTASVVPIVLFPPEARLPRRLRK